MKNSHQHSGSQRSCGVLTTHIGEDLILEQSTPSITGTHDIYITPTKTPDIIKQKEDAFNVLFINYMTTAMKIFFKLLNAIKMGEGCY